MAKAYDRVQWPFLLKVLEKMGFSGRWIGLIERCISSNWFSVLINGSSGGFFKSTRGLRQGDPLSPALFVLAAEYLSRTLDKTILGNKELEFSTSRHAPGVSHLAYADDIIVFSKASSPAIRKVIQCIDHYAAVSGQKINMGKSHFFMDNKYRGWRRRVARMSGFQQGSLPFEYLGVPIFRGIKRTAMFTFLRDKISKRIHSWSHKYLSFGGRLTLIKSTLGATPLHIFQVIEPTEGMMKQMESIIARFFWGSNNDCKRTHWIAWEQICHPIDEGGLGIRRFRDMVAAFSMKLWWRFRERESLWAEFMLKKYCHTASPLTAKSLKRNSPTWKRMIRARSMTHHHMRWAIGRGDVDFWDDIWLLDQPIRNVCNPGIELPRLRIRDLWSGNAWDEQRLRTFLLPLGVPNDLVERIVETPIDEAGADTARWMTTPHGNFTTSSAWETIRHQQERMEIFKLIWCSAVSPSMSIFIWRLLFNRIPVDAKLQWRNIHLASKCRCCKNPKGETREHLFILGEAAKKIWSFFANWFPALPAFPTDLLEIEQRITWWRSNMVGTASDHANIVIPCFILWFIWIERNNVVHRGASFSSDMVIERIKNHLQWAILARKLQTKHWRGVVPNARFRFPQPATPRPLRSYVIRWQRPQQHWMKLNTDGAFAGNSMLAGGGGVVRNEHGTILRGFADHFHAGSAIEAELKALLRGLNLVSGLGANLWIEVDAQEVISLTETGRRGAAELRHILTEIRNKLKGYIVRISHIPREGNAIADFLAKQGRGQELRVVFDHNSVPPFVRALARLDSLGVPTFRRPVEGSDEEL